MAESPRFRTPSPVKALISLKYRTPPSSDGLRTRSQKRNHFESVIKYRSQFMKPIGSKFSYYTWTGSSSDSDESEKENETGGPEPLDLRPAEPTDQDLFREGPVRGEIRQVLSPLGQNVISVAATQLRDGVVVEIPIKSEVVLPGAVDPHTASHPAVRGEASGHVQPSSSNSYGTAVRLTSPTSNQQRCVKNRSGPQAPRTKWVPIPDVSLKCKEAVLNHKNADRTFRWRRLYESSSPPSITYACVDSKCSARRKYVFNRATMEWSLLESSGGHVDPHEEAFPEAERKVETLIHAKLEAMGGKTAAVSTFHSPYIFVITCVVPFLLLNSYFLLLT